jgi:rRNA maturation endonuclease Nob1
MGMGFETVAMPGIKGPYTWTKKCTACGKEYNEDVSECEACGSNHFKVIKEQRQAE